MGTVVGLPAGPDLTAPCNQCLACFIKSFRGGDPATRAAVPNSDSVYRLAIKGVAIETREHYLGAQLYQDLVLTSATNKNGVSSEGDDDDGDCDDD